MQQTIESIIIPELDAVTQFATRKRSDSYTIKIQRGVEKRMEAIEGREQRISLPKSIRYSIQGIPSFLPLSLSLSFLSFLYTSNSPSAPTFRSVSLSPPSLSSHRNIPYSRRRMPFLHDYLAGCSARMQRYTRATRCIDDDNVAYRLVRPACMFVACEPAGIISPLSTTRCSAVGGARNVNVEFSKVRLPACYRRIVSVSAI